MIKPNNLDECFPALKQLLLQDELSEFMNIKESELIQYHSTLGRFLRNCWGLWEGSPLKDYFNSLGINHADDMSGIIITSFWRHINNKPLDLDNQVLEYKKYWEKNNGS